MRPARAEASGAEAAARGVAAPAASAITAPRPDGATEMLQPMDVTEAIFVDGSGRRGRRLRRVASLLLAVALLLLLAFWLLQGLDVVGASG